MFDYVFTIGCFDKLHKGHIKLLETIKTKTNKLIIGLHDNKSIKALKNVSDIDPYHSRKQNLKEYADDVFMIEHEDPTRALQEYISSHFGQQTSAIKIGASSNNTKLIESDYTGNLHFFHKYKDTFECVCDSKAKTITVKRTDNSCGWGQDLIAYKHNWCFIRGDDNQSFPAIKYVKSVMPIQYLPYSREISATQLRNFMHDKVGLMNHLLKEVVKVLDQYEVPYYLDCGTLLGVIRDNELMEKDTDVDVTIHLSDWEKLNAIDFERYGLIRTRTMTGYPNKEDGNMISVRTKYSESLYCDIYSNPAFPLLEEKVLNGNTYKVPQNSDLYLTQLYGNWKVPSENHAMTKYHRGNGLVNSEYSAYWDKLFDIFECIM